MKKPIAFLGKTFKRAANYIHANHTVCCFNPASGVGDIMLDGIRRPFRIVTEEHHLRGMEISDYRYAGDGVSPRLIDLARLMMR